MKVALIMYGHLRTYKKCHAKLKQNFIDKYNADVFIHTWDEIEAKTKSWHNRHMDVTTLSKTNLTDLKNIYSPKGLLIEHQSDMETADLTTPNNAISALGQERMLHSMFMADQLKSDYETKNNFKYDVVVKIRPDILLVNPLVLPEVSEGVDHIAGNRIGLKQVNDIQKYKACDIINISTSSDMTKICAAEKEFEKFFVENVLAKTFIHSGFVDHMLFQNLKLNILDFNYNRDWTIVRKASKRKNLK